MIKNSSNPFFLQNVSKASGIMSVSHKQTSDSKTAHIRITAIMNKFKGGIKLSSAEWAELRRLSPQAYASAKACEYIEEQKEMREEQIRENIEQARIEKIEQERIEEAQRNKRNQDRFIRD